MDGEVERQYLGDYMVARPDRASLYDIVQLLFTSDVSASNAVDCPSKAHAVEEAQRLLMASSLLLQKGFRAVKSPVLQLGRAIESMGNLLSDSNGIGDLAFKLLHGAVVDPTSAAYQSFVSLLDVRVELDRSIKPMDPRYRAALSVMASKLAYQNEANIMHTVRYHWNMEFLGYFNCWNDFEGVLSTQAFMFADRNVDARVIVVAFRGTEPFNMDDWSVDVDLSWHEIPNVGKVHAGFMKALGLQRPGRWPKEPSSGEKPFAYYVIRDELKRLLPLHPNANFILTGHSLGGALAALYPLVLALQEEEEILARLEAVYTFGQPRVGDAQLGKFMSRLLDGDRQRYFRFVYNNDLIPRVPFDNKAILFKHWGRTFYYNSCYKGQVLEEQPQKNYFSVVGFWENRASAAWELARSFWIGWTEGPEYREGWAQMCVRLVGLVSPGLANHGFQDYVNCTRLGNPLEVSHDE